MIDYLRNKVVKVIRLLLKEQWVISSEITFIELSTQHCWRHDVVNVSVRGWMTPYLASEWAFSKCFFSSLWLFSQAVVPFSFLPQFPRRPGSVTPSVRLDHTVAAQHLAHCFPTLAAESESTTTQFNMQEDSVGHFKLPNSNGFWTGQKDTHTANKICNVCVMLWCQCG